MFKMLAGTVSLTEAGKKIAKRNASRLKAAIAAMQEMLAEVGDVEEAAIAESGRDLAEAMLRRSDSADAKAQALRSALREALKVKHQDPMRPDSYVYVWVQDLYPAASSVISSTFWKSNH